MEIQLLVDSETIMWGKGVMGSTATLSVAHNETFDARTKRPGSDMSVIVKLSSHNSGTLLPHHFSSG